MTGCVLPDVLQVLELLDQKWSQRKGNHADRIFLKTPYTTVVGNLFLSFFLSAYVQCLTFINGLEGLCAVQVKN